MFVTFAFLAFLLILWLLRQNKLEIKDIKRRAHKELSNMKNEIRS